METRKVIFKYHPDNAYGVRGSAVFCHVSPEYRGWKWMGCVGWLWDTAQVKLTGKGAYTDLPPDGFISTDKFRLGCAKLKEIEHYTNACKVINLFEKASGMRSRTKVYATQHEDRFLFEGHTDWISSSFMISLFTNLVRIAADGVVADTVEDFKVRMVHKLVEAGKYSWQNQYFKHCYDRIPIIIKNRKELTWSSFPYSSKYSIHSYGIGALMDGQQSLGDITATEAARAFKQKVDNETNSL